MSGSEVERAIRALSQGASPGVAVRKSARRGAGLTEMRSLLNGITAQESGVGLQVAQLLADPAVTDILINSTTTWVDRGRGLEKVDLNLGGEKDVRALAIRMAAACGKRLDDASPIVDGSLPQGVRLHAVLAAPSASGTLISLRTSRAAGLSLSHMEASGSVSAPFGSLLRTLVATKANVLISGATGSGKTTLLSALLALVPHTERIICIEEIPELKPIHPHVVSLVERRPNIQGVGGIELSELVRAAMRMRPDRLILGECRGPEVRDVLLALNTGHEGGWATIHANGCQEVPARLVALGALAGLSEAAVAAQAVAAFDAVVHMSRMSIDGDERRRVCQIATLSRSNAELQASIALELLPTGGLRRGPGWARLEEILGVELPEVNCALQAGS